MSVIINIIRAIIYPVLYIPLYIIGIVIILLVLAAYLSLVSEDIFKEASNLWMGKTKNRLKKKAFILRAIMYVCMGAIIGIIMWVKFEF